MLRAGRHVFAIALGCVTAAIIYLSWFPQPTTNSGPDFCFACGERATADAILNVAFYVPLGITLGLTRVRFIMGVVLAALLSTSMEVGQIFISGRFPSPLDVLTNTVGASLGLLGMRTRAWWMDLPYGWGIWLSCLSAAVAVATFFATGYLMAPDFQAGIYFGQWVPNLGGYERYEGTVHRVSIGPYHLPSTRVENGGEIRHLLEEGEPLHVWATAAPPPSSLSPIFGLVRQPRMQLLMVGVKDGDLALRIRPRAGRWRLDRPTRYARGLMAELRPGADLHIQVWRSDDETCASVNQLRDCGLAPTIGHGWGLLMDPEWDSATAHVLLAFGWVVLLTAPVGFSLHNDVRSFAGPVLVVAGAWAAPHFTSLGGTAIIDWLAIAVGLGSGSALSGPGRAVICRTKRYDGAVDT